MYRFEKDGAAFSVENLNSICVHAADFFTRIKNGEFTFALYETDETVKEFYCDRLSSLSDL
jgi:hypothetical protein